MGPSLVPRRQPLITLQAYRSSFMPACLRASLFHFLMFNNLPFARRHRPSPSDLLPGWCNAGPVSPSLSHPAQRVGRLLLFAIGVGLASACTSESHPDQSTAEASAPVAEEAPCEAASACLGSVKSRPLVAAY